MNKLGNHPTKLSFGDSIMSFAEDGTNVKYYLLALYNSSVGNSCTNGRAIAQAVSR
jgi:hypothetical protein